MNNSLRHCMKNNVFEYDPKILEMRIKYNIIATIRWNQTVQQKKMLLM